MPHAQAWVEHGLGSSRGPCAWCPRVEDGGGNVARQTRELLIALVLHARLEFLGLVACQGGLCNDAPGHAQAVGRHLAVFGVLR